MLAALIAAGAIPLVSGGGTGPVIGTVDLPAAQMVIITRTGAASSVSGLPVGAPSWLQALDPSDRVPFGFDLSDLVGAAKIVGILGLTMSAAGQAVGVEFETAAPYQPVIDEGGHKLMVYVSVAELFRANAAFTGTGIRAGLAVWVETDATPPERLERSGVLNVRQQ